MSKKNKPNENMKAAPKLGQNSKQYIVFVCIILPILFLVGWFMEPAISSTFLKVVIYIVLILAGWLFWLFLRTFVQRRSERIRRMREDQRKKVDMVMKNK
ncbi:MAG: hypothetical protein FWD89_03155 [Firmicutes bacterium]|nr:hypothetical protein [Bacillota bacterium]MCL2771288.1 hypothetical protein [Bacillota bacterium]